MYIIAGLGNPGKEYAHTRHNVGFDTIDILADRYNISVDTVKNKSLVGKGIIEGNKVLLVKPLTYMNLSGESLRAIVDYYKIDARDELVVIYDDIYLDVGQLRIRPKGSAGGHNGIKNIILHLGTEEFMRIRVGVGNKPKSYELKDYVLGHFSSEERQQLDRGLINAGNAVVEIMNKSIDSAMNKYNTKISNE